jgi:pSer/pThr/pTyr-binding forkhead associated (FHA) protein
MPAMGATVALPPQGAPPGVPAMGARAPVAMPAGLSSGPPNTAPNPIGPTVPSPTTGNVATAATVAAPAPPLAGPPPAAGGATVVCPQCGHINTPSNLFCGSCGFRLGGATAAARPTAAAPPPPPAEAATGPGIVLTALRADGTEAGTFPVPAGVGTIGRETGGIFAGDSYLSPRHATFRVGGPGRASVKDEGSLNGVYKRLARDTPTELRPNEVFRIGQEIIKFEPLTSLPPTADGVERLGAPIKGYVGRIALVIGREETGNAFPVPESGVHLGRERGDILFPEDGYVSGLHCRLSWDGRKLFLTDLGSSNGTFVRVGETDLRAGDVLLMGQQLFRVAV